MIISVRLMLEYLDELDMAKTLDTAITKVIAEGKVRTYDHGRKRNYARRRKGNCALLLITGRLGHSRF